MSLNLTDWLGNNPWALWLTVALLLGIAEILSLDLVLIMLAVGALAGAGVSLIAPGAWWLQILVAAGASVGMLAVLRPTLLAKVRNLPGYRSSLDKMVGSVGVEHVLHVRFGDAGLATHLLDEACEFVGKGGGHGRNSGEVCRRTAGGRGGAHAVGSGRKVTYRQ